MIETNMKVNLGNVVPVKHITILGISQGAARGYAAPADGPNPCGLLACSGIRVLGVTLAIGYSSEAAAAGLRHGWCGFDLAGVTLGAALGESTVIRCAATGRVLTDLKDLHAEKPKELTKPRLSVQNILEIVRQQKNAPDIFSVVPFAKCYLDEAGIASFVEASYLYLLGRPSDPGGLQKYSREIESGLSVADVWKDIMTSDEFIGRLTHSLPGPFDPEFPFGRDALR